MNTASRLFASSLLTLAFVSSIFAETGTRAKLVSERDAILASFVQDAEHRFSTGTGTEEEVLAAKLALHSFRRDFSTTRELRLASQETIIGLLKARIQQVKARIDSGLGTQQQLLREKDRLLEAQIVLEDLRAGSR